MSGILGYVGMDGMGIVGGGHREDRRGKVSVFSGWDD